MTVSEKSSPVKAGEDVFMTDNQEKRLLEQVELGRKIRDVAMWRARMYVDQLRAMREEDPEEYEALGGMRLVRELVHEARYVNWFVVSAKRALSRVAAQPGLFA